MIVDQHLHDLSFSHTFSGQTKDVTNTKSLVWVFQDLKWVQNQV